MPGNPLPVPLPGTRAMEKYTIIIIEDHKLISEAWQVALNEHPQFDVVGTFDSGEEAIAQAEHLKPDLALVDITLPGMNGIQVTLSR
jgi:two-component system, NarL family, nitrate/nitrite response regulator NarL